MIINVIVSPEIKFQAVRFGGTVKIAMYFTAHGCIMDNGLPLAAGVVDFHAQLFPLIEHMHSSTTVIGPFFPPIDSVVVVSVD